MAKTKLTIVLDDRLADELRGRVSSRKRSRFVAGAIRRELRDLREAELRKAYMEAYEEAREEDRALDGCTGDGIS